MDQVLHAHLAAFKSSSRISGLDCNIVFDMSGGFSPISIKDQVIRASLIVERAIERKLITAANSQKKSERPLLVIGGGISGVAACYHASKRNIQSFLIEKERAPLAKYTFYGDRLVIPNQYDWPFPQWQQNEFPFAHSSEIYIKLKEFSIGARNAKFKLYWEATKNSGLNTVCNNNEVTSIVPVNPSYGGSFAAARIALKVPHPKPDFGMVLFTTGFGQEKTYVEKNGASIAAYPKRFMGVPFWNLNPLTIDKIRAAGAERNVLISGGGDGALQDFLLFVTGEKSVKDIYSQLPTPIRNYERAVADAENFAHRSEIWAGNRNDTPKSVDCLTQRSHKIYHELHRAHLEIIREIKLNTTLWNDIKISLSTMVEPFFRNFGNRITLAYPCDHFTKCYAFNRFLTLLIAAYIEEEFGERVLLPQTAITDISPNAHSCQIDVINQVGNSPLILQQKIDAASKCFDEEHSIKFRQKSCAGFESAEADLPGLFSPVIIRFGIELPALNYSLLDKPYYTPQILPYAIPSKS